MRQDPSSATSKTYELKFPMFKNGKPEEFLQMMKYFNTATDGTGTTPTKRKTQFLLTMLRGEALREFDVLSSQVGSTTNGHIKFIKEFLLGYFPPINILNNQKRAMRRAIQKH